MKTNYVLKMVLLWIAISLNYVSFAQENVNEEEEVEDFSDDVLYAPCIGAQFEQWYVINLPQSSILYLDLLELPNSEVEIYSEDGILVSSTLEQHASISLEKYKKYKVRSTNSCNEIVEYFEVSTFPSNTKENMIVPGKLYKFITDKLKAESEITLWEYALESDALTASEKMHLIQEYYLDGDISNLGDDFFGDVEGVEGSDIIIEIIDDGRFGELLNMYVYPIQNKNCKCKTVQPQSNYLHLNSGVLTFNNGYKEFESKKTSFVNEYAAKKRYFYWRDSTTGAAKSQRVKQYMKASHSKTEIAAFPNNAEAGTPNQTTISFLLLCESKSGEMEDCMCENRSVKLHANYTTQVQAYANKINCTFCGSGYNAFAQVEDWAVLTKFSPRTNFGVIDAGRVLSHDQRMVSHNPEWKLKAHDVIYGVVKAYYGSYYSGTFLTSIFDPLHQQIQDLLSAPMHTGGSSGSNSGAAVLINTTNRSFTLLPNDPTDFTIHSFSRHEMKGHTKWKAETWVSSSVSLAGYMRYKETEECCNESLYSYIVAGQNQSDHYNQLNGVNHFLKNGFFPINFPNKYGYQVTDEHHFGDYSSNKCSPNYHSATAPIVIPQNTPYTIKKILTGETKVTGITSLDGNNSDFVRLIEENDGLTPGLYVIEYLINGELYHYKTNKL